MNDQENSRYRQLKGSAAFLWRSLIILIPVSGIFYILSLHQYIGLPLFGEQYAGFILALMLSAIFIGVPAGRSASRERVPWYDWLFAILGMSVGMYIVLYYPQITLQFANVSTERFIMSFLAVVLILEALRRMMGWTLVIIVLSFLAYGFVAPAMPGLLQGQSTTFTQLLNYLYLDTNSILDLLRLAATIGLAFILFGQTLIHFKGGDIFNNIALTFFGRFRGGPAKASVIGSSMVGSITGGPVANITLTGSMTIPLMIKRGFSRVQAGAIETVASSGGEILPPIMGLVAFIIAENIGVPYKEVALAALVPALLYYLCLFVQVDLIAAKKGLGGIPKKELPRKLLVLKTGWLIIPIFGFLFYYLFIEGRSPANTGVISAGIAVLFLLIQRDVRTGLISRVRQTLMNTGRILLEIGIILAAAGLMVGIVGITGLGFNLVFALTQLGQYGLFILLFFSAVVCVILGMGMPGIAAYAIVAVLVAPSLQEFGVPAMAAHLFVFYFSIVSNFTPPIALASFTAAPLANASPHQISFLAVRLGMMAYIIPFLFVYNPIILLSYNAEYSYVNIGVSIITAIIACIVLSISITGYLFRPINIVSRLILVVGAVLMFVPVEHTTDWLINASGFIICVLLIMYERISSIAKLKYVQHRKHKGEGASS